MANAIIELTSGPAGTGKSYSRVARFIVDEWLPNRTGTIYTNVNLGRVPADHPFTPAPWTDAQGRERRHESFIRRMCNAAAKRYGGKPADYARRVRRIPPAIVKQWRDGISGPWEYFKPMDLGAAHIQIDEIHVFCPARGVRRAKPWQDFLGEIRHMGCTIEFMTQHTHKLNRDLMNEAGVRRTLMDASGLRDPYFKIPLGDWYELKAIFTGKYQKTTYVQEEIRKGNRWSVNFRSKFKYLSEYFAFYNSHERPHHGGKAGREEKHQHERRSKLGVVAWFAKRHPFSLGTRFGGLAVICWLCFGGGAVSLFGFYMSYLMNNTMSDAAKAAQVETQPVAMVEHHEPAESDEVVEVVPIGEPVYVPADPVELPEPIFYDPPADPPATQETQQLRDQLAALQAAHEEALQLATELKESRDRASAVVLVTPHEVTFREGYSYGVGDLIDYGPYEGKRVTAINYSRRAVILDDEIILRMGRDADELPAVGVPAEAINNPHVKPATGLR